MQGKFIGGKSPNAKKVICVTTGEIFDSMIEAGEKYGVSYRAIGTCCQGKINGVKAKKTKYKGKKLYWMKYENYLKLNNKEEII